MPPVNTTYDQYMELIAHSSPSRLQEESHLIIERFHSQHHISLPFIPTTFFVDYTSRKYVYIDKSCIQFGGYPDTYFYEEGHEGFIKRTHPSEYEVVNKKIFPINLSYLQKISPEKYPDLVFSHNFRFKNSADEYIMLLQRYSYVPGKEINKPIGVIGVVYDITHFKNDMSIVHTIEETKWHNNEPINELLYKEAYPVYDITPPQQMSKREIQIIKLMAEGFSSKQIADKLQLSSNTVSNHRKKMLQKTNCKTSSELLSHAVKHGII